LDITTQQLDSLESIPVFGAGTFGQRLAKAIENVGVSVPFIVDTINDRDFDFEYRRLSDLGSVPHIALGVHNPDANLEELVVKLGSKGIQVWTAPQVANWLVSRGQEFTNYWLDPGAIERADGSQIEAARSKLSDELSRTCFDRVLKYRQTGDFRLSRPESSVSDHYLPTDVPFTSPGMRYADVGAFNGDTVRALRDRIPRYVDALICLEPDSASYSKLLKTLESWPQVDWMALPLAAWKSVEQLDFVAEGTGASRIGSGGNSTIQAVALDDILLNWRPTHIKMDIEAAEPQAIQGMIQTLDRHRPRLAISAYHRPEHHWELINQVDDLGLGYEFFMRNNGHQTFEVVIYAVPKG
jgi:FkbM family methyltransferase